MVLNKESLLVGWLYLCRDIENTVGDDKRPMELLFKVHHLFQWKQFMFRLPVQPAACSCSNNFSLQSSVASRVSTKLSRVLFNSWHGWSILLFIEKLWIANGGIGSLSLVSVVWFTSVFCYLYLKSSVFVIADNPLYCLYVLTNRDPSTMHRHWW